MIKISWESVVLIFCDFLCIGIHLLRNTLIRKRDGRVVEVNEFTFDVGAVLMFFDVGAVFFFLFVLCTCLGVFIFLINLFTCFPFSFIPLLLIEGCTNENYVSDF